jgi:hypothetical protein
MLPRLAPVATILRTNTRIYHLALDGLTDVQLRERPAPGANCALWIAGHALAARTLVARLAGGAYDFPAADLFARGRPAPDPADLPSASEIHDHWDAVAAVILEHFERLTDDELDAPVEGDYPVDLPGRLGALSFLALHDSYHLGQLGYLRSALGLPGFAG